MKKVIIVMTMFFVLLVCLGVQWVQSTVKQVVILKVNQLAGVDLTFEELEIHWLRGGFEIKDISVSLNDHLIKSATLKSLEAYVQWGALFKKSFALRKVIVSEGSLYCEELPFGGERVVSKASSLALSAKDSVVLSPNKSSVPAFHIRVLQLENIEVYVQKDRLINVELLKLKNFLDPLLVSSVSIRALLGMDTLSPLFLESKFKFDGHHFQLLSLKENLHDFSLKFAQPFLPKSFVLDGTIDVLASMKTQDICDVSLRLKNGTLSGDSVNKTTQGIMQMNSDFKAQLMVSDLGTNPYFTLSVPALSFAENGFVKDFSVKGFLEKQQGLYQWDELVVGQWRYHHIKAPKPLERKKTLHDFKEQVRKNVISKSHHSYPVLIKNIRFNQGTVSYTDQTQRDPQTFTLEDMNMRFDDVDFSKKRRSPFEVSARFGRAPFRIDGSLLPLTQLEHLNYKASLSRVSLRQLDSFLPNDVKDRISAGSLFFYSEGTFESGYLDSFQDVVMSDLQFIDGGGMLLGRPVEDIVSYLKNKKGVVELSFPIQQNIYKESLDIRAILKDLVVQQIFNKLAGGLGSFPNMGQKTRPAVAEGAKSSKDELKELGRSLEKQFKQLLFSGE